MISPSRRGCRYGEEEDLKTLIIRKAKKGAKKKKGERERVRLRVEARCQIGRTKQLYPLTSCRVRMG